ncbi:hypothetical protein B0H13DRAFT_905504 [Mycena leptocephala]|nr:hypothetical protein B0H13DRAFT_905504 [Mycena leptocephala]
MFRSPYHRRPWSRGYWTNLHRPPALHSPRASHPPPSRVPRIHPSTHPHASTKSTLLKSISALSSLPTLLYHSQSQPLYYTSSCDKSSRPSSVHTHPSGARYIHLLLHTRVHICITFSFIHTYILFLPLFVPRIFLPPRRVAYLPHLLTSRTPASSRYRTHHRFSRGFTSCVISCIASL